MTIDVKQRIGCQYELFVVIINGFERIKFSFSVFRREHIADLQIKTSITLIRDEIYLCHALLAYIDVKTTADKLSVGDVFKQTRNIIIAITEYGMSDA